MKPKSTTSKTATKAKPATKKKVLVDHDENGEHSAMEVDEENDAFDEDEPASVAPKAKPAAARKKKTASETYTKVQRVISLCIQHH
jgi:DNA topoisomerase-2